MAVPRIEPETAESYRVWGGRADRGLILLCDHASNALPASYGTLGLPEAELQRHIGYDIGAAAITERLSRLLDAPAVLTRHSRLLIDPNRGEDDPTLIMRLSDGAVIPGNNGLTAAERQHRIQRYYRPYHRAVARTVDQCLQATRNSGRPPIVFSVHSMTPVWKGVARPWHVAILWHRDGRLAEALLAGFRADQRLIVGDNEPYQGGLEGDTLALHAQSRGLQAVSIEYRQDLVADDRGQDHWADATARILSAVLDNPSRLDQPMTQSPAPVDATPTDATQMALEAAAYRRLVAHLRTRSDVQNIDLMNLAGFCRNCLANWMQDAAAAQGLPLSKDAAREGVYGMPYKDWQAKFQKEATPAQKAAFTAGKPHDHG
jgi:predicted N-formylglutamate amidohydrolase